MNAIARPAWLDRGMEAASKRLRVLRAEQCPRCESPGGDVARACVSRGEALELDGAPLCRWSAEVQAEHTRRERARDRQERLQRAGFTDAEVARLIVESARPPAPPQPSAGFLEMWAAIAQFQREPERRSLTLVGGTGVGKSVASAWLIAEVPGSLLVRAASVRPDEGWDALHRRAKAAALVVVEDLGLEHEGQSGWHARELEGLLCSRHDAGRRSVVTTNLPLRGEGSIQQRYGDRVLSRLLDRSRGSRVVGCGNEDLRWGE